MGAVDQNSSRLAGHARGANYAQDGEVLHLARSIIERNTSGYRPWPRTKRVFDTTVIVVAAPPVLLLSILIALAIFMEDRGPVFFRQTRVGMNGVPFNIWKFRTMVPNAHERQAELAAFNECRGGVFKMRNDPRVTRIGRFLRKTSLDELPQLLNVLKGEMALVGPRACSLPVQSYSEEQLERLSVTPGIVGPAQIWLRHGDFNQKTELEIFYLQRMSAKLDLYLLLRAVLLIVRPTGV